MQKEDFKAALRAELMKVPLHTRRNWSNTDLFTWWIEVQGEHPSLTWEECIGGVWQWIPGMCRDLIGVGATA
jgi:hypothetical protein